MSRAATASPPAAWRSRSRGGQPSPGRATFAIGGATLAAEAADLGLIDEYGLRVHPVLVGGGTAFFPRAERRADLELICSRALMSGVVDLRYRVPH